jgi:arginyl-tRNA--protein-N-Asp/Glu arginylyltransferase
VIEAALIVMAGIVVGSYLISSAIDAGFRKLQAMHEREALATRDKFEPLRAAAKAYTFDWEDRRRAAERAGSSYITQEEADRRKAATLAAGGRVFDG